MSDTIHIVEPTLINEAGHCYSFIESLCRASRDVQIRLWIGRNALIDLAGNNIKITQYFNRRLRKLQSFILYRRLLRAPGKILVSTAGNLDLLLINWASHGAIPPDKVYLYFHWFRITEKKLAAIRRIALVQPELQILGPTPSVVNIFRDAGFSHARVVPYPLTHQSKSARTRTGKFAHLLFAGAARQDKGFSNVVELVAFMHDNGLNLPITIQTSPEHYGKYDAKTKSDIQRLSEINYAHLSVTQDTLDKDAYLALFEGAICIQLYDTKDFADRVSGVTLDAFSAGSPIIATDGTWIARMARRFDAGVVLTSWCPQDLYDAIELIISRYAHFSENAVSAGSILQTENAAESLFTAIAN
jgi:hypothetical protein